MASPKPGGYIAKGGVFDFKRTLDYLEAGKAAGKFESELSGEDGKREDRSAQTAANNTRPQRQR